MGARWWAVTWALVALGVIPVVPRWGGHPSRSPVTPDGGQASLSEAKQLVQVPAGPAEGRAPGRKFRSPPRKALGVEAGPRAPQTQKVGGRG